MDVLDLTHLDEEERRVIMAVIKRDEEFEKSENERIRRLKNSVETQRRTGQVSPAIERGLLARTGDWFSKRYRSVIGATPLVKMSLLREKKVSSTPFQTEPSENNVMQKKDPIDKRQPISEPQSERILAPVTISSFPPLVTKEVHERPMQPSNVDDTPFPHQVKPSYEKGDSSSSSPIISSDESEPEMKQKGHSHPPQDELNGQPPKRFFKSRLATDTRFQKVLPDLSAQKLPPARVPVMDRSQHGTPPQSPRVPPQRHNTPHSPLGSKETSPQSSPIIFGTFTARRHASPEATRRDSKHLEVAEGVDGADGNKDKKGRPNESAIEAQLAMFEQLSKRQNVYLRDDDEEGDDFIEEQVESTESESGLEESGEEQKSEGISAQSDGTQSSETQSSGTQSSGTQSIGTQSSGTQSSETQSSGTQSSGTQSEAEAQSDDEPVAKHEMSEGSLSDREMVVAAARDKTDGDRAQEVEQSSEGYEQSDQTGNVMAGLDTLESNESDEAIGEHAQTDEEETATTKQDSHDAGVGIQTMKSRETHDGEDEQDGQTNYMQEEEPHAQVMGEVKLEVDMETDERKQLDEARIAVIEQEIQTEPIQLEQDIHLNTGIDIGVRTSVSEANRIVNDPINLVKEKNEESQKVIGIDMGVGTDAAAETETKTSGTRSTVAEQDTQTEQQDVQTEVDSTGSISFSDFAVTTEAYLESQPLPPPVLDQDIKGEVEGEGGPSKDEDVLHKVAQIEPTTIDNELPPDPDMAGSSSPGRGEKRCKAQMKHVPEEASVEVEHSSSQTSAELGHSEAFLMVSDYQVKTVRNLQPEGSESETRSREGKVTRMHVTISVPELGSTDILDQFRRRGQKLDQFRRKGKKHYEVSAGDPEDFEETMGLKHDVPLSQSPSWADMDLTPVHHETGKEREESPSNDKDDRPEVQEWKRLQSKKYSINSRITVFETMAQQVSPSTSPRSSPRSSPTRRPHQSQETPQITVSSSEGQRYQKQPLPALEEVQMRKAEIMQSRIIPLATEAAHEQQGSTESQEVDVKKIEVAQREMPSPLASFTPLIVSEVKAEVVGTPKSQRVGRQYQLESTEEIEEGEVILFQSEDVSDEVLFGEDVPDGKPLPSAKLDMANLEESAMPSTGGMQPSEPNQWQLVYGLTPFSETLSERDETVMEDQSVEQSRDKIREQVKEEATSLQAGVHVPGSGETEQDVHPVLNVLSQDSAETEVTKQHTEVADSGMPELAKQKQEESPKPTRKKKSRSFRQPSAPAPLPPQTASSPPEAAAVQTMPLDGAKATGEIATLLSQTREDSPSPHQSAESSPTAHRRREASPTNNAPRTRSREPSPLVQRKNDEAAPAVAISLASGKNVEREEQIEVLSRQTSGTSSVSSGSQAESALQQVQSEGYLSPFGGGLKKKSKSKESLTLSTYSLAGKGKSVAVTGELYFGVRYNHLSNQLEVNIVEARGLAPADSSGTSDPYVKTYLLPDKSKESKRKTQIVKKSLNPVFNKSLTYKLKKEDVGLRRLWIAIYDWDRFGSNTFLGEVRIDLSKHDLTSGVPQWYKLQELDPDEGRPANRGELLLAIRFVPPDAAEGQQEKKKKKKKELKGDFQVLMKRARNLTAMDSSGLSDPFVKCYLLPDKSRSGKHKTKTIFRDLNPIWEEMLVYKGVTLEALRHRVLEVTVWDFDRAGSNDFIGGLRLGLSANQLSVEKKKLEPWMDAREDEAAQWQEMIENPNTFIGKWHVLRSTMDPRH